MPLTNTSLFIKKILLLMLFISFPLSANNNNNLYGYLIDGSQDIKINNSTKMIKLLIDEIFLKDNFDFRVNLYKNYDQLSKDYYNSKMSIASMDSYFYIKNKKKLDANTHTIWSISQNNNSALHKLYFVVNKNSKIKSYKDIKNKKIAVRKDNYWAKTFFLKQSKLKTFDFINLDTEKMILLKTFFNNYDGCIVSSKVYDLMIELNPSIEKKVEKIDVSEQIFLRNLVIISNKIPKNDIKRINKQIGFYTSKEGKKDITRLFDVTSAKKTKNNEFKKLEKFYKEFLEKR